MTFDNDPTLHAAIDSGHCPDCHHRGFVIGPQALGMSTNIECGNLNCRHRFNVARWMGVTAFVHRLPSVAEGGVMWASEPRTATGATQ